MKQFNAHAPFELDEQLHEFVIRVLRFAAGMNFNVDWNLGMGTPDELASLLHALEGLVPNEQRRVQLALSDPELNNYFDWLTHAHSTLLRNGVPVTAAAIPLLDGFEVFGSDWDELADRMGSVLFPESEADSN